MDPEITLQSGDQGSDALGRFDALAPGAGFVLLGAEAPREALRALQAERADRFDWSVLEAGPRQWRVEIRRRSSDAPRGPNEYLTWDHRRLDALLDDVRRSLGAGELEAAASVLDAFACGLDHHIDMEETVLFPEIEARSAMAAGPTSVMRTEHVAIRRLLAAMTRALSERSPERFEQADGELTQILGVHNMKEEQILYPLSDRVAGGAEGRASLVRRMQAS